MKTCKVHGYVYIKHPFTGDMAINSEAFRDAFNEFLKEQAGKGRELVFATPGCTYFIFRKVEPFAINFTEVSA